MKKNKTVIRYPLIVAAAITIALFSCSKDDDENLEPNPILDTESPSVVIQTPTTENAFSTIEENLSLSGIAQDNNNIKKVQWKINDGAQNDATGKTDWNVNNVSLDEGDNIFVVYAEDESNNYSSQYFGKYSIN